MTPIPFVDLRSLHEEVGLEIDRAIRDLLHSSQFVGGPYVANFEAHFGSYCGLTHAVAVASGTDALRLALKAVGVKAGDEVITPPNTFIATVEAITQVGGHPVFVDIDPDTRTIDPGCLEAFLTNSCRQTANNRMVNRHTGRPVVGLVPVHLYGLPANMMLLKQIADKYNLWIVEDACQAHGAAYCVDGEWQGVGTIGRAAAFSFYPSKNLGAIGEAGAVVTNDADLAAAIRLLRDHGQCKPYIHVTPDGSNARLDAIQCAVLDIKLKKLDEWNERRRAVAALYSNELADLPLKLPLEPAYARHVYHLYVVEADQRDRLRQALSANDIATGLHYPIPLHRQPAYAYLGLPAGSFPCAERSAGSVLSLPMHPALKPSDVERIAAALRAAQLQ